MSLMTAMVLLEIGHIVIDLLLVGVLLLRARRNVPQLSYAPRETSQATHAYYDKTLREQGHSPIPPRASKKR